MNPTTDVVLAWLLRGGLWWAALAVGLGLWFRVRPPRTSAVRHAALASAIFAGMLAGALPRWGNGIIAGPRSTPGRDVLVHNLSPAARNSFDKHPTQTARVASEGNIANRSAPPPAIEAPTTAAAAPPSPPASPRDWASTVRRALGAVWLFGILLFGWRLARSVAVAARWRREAKPLPASERASFEAVRRELNVRRRVDAGLHPELFTPMVLCGRPPLVLVPSDWPNWDDESRLAAWRHELAHVQRRDDWWRMLSEALRVVWWFHPGVHWLLARREHEAELLSDETAVAGGCQPRELARILIEACRRPQNAAWPATAGAFLAPRTTKARIARLIDCASVDALCRPAPRALRFAATVGVLFFAFAGSMRWVASAGAALPTGSPKAEAEPLEVNSGQVKVVIKLVDDATGKPVTRAACEWGLANPAKKSEFIWGSRGEAVRDNGMLDMTFDLEHGRLIRYQVLAAGYERAEVVEEISIPTPSSLERTVRLKRGRVVSGTLRDYQGKPVAKGRVFFVPAGRPWQSIRIVEGVPDSPSVAEARTNAEGRFNLSAATAGTIAASTDTVDLWAFPLPPPGVATELVMPAPTSLKIDLAYWYLDAPDKTTTAVSSDSEDPNQCWILIDRLGTRDPLVDAIDYHRALCVFAKDPSAKLSKGVSIGPLEEGARPQAIPGVGHNRRMAASSQITLPPGRYLLQRLRAGAGAYAPIDRTTIDVAAGAEASLKWKRAEGAAVRGKVNLPANSSFVRAAGEAPQKLDWSIPTTAFVVLHSADGAVRDAARIRADGSFFVSTHLEPGSYKAEAVVILPASNDLRHGLALPPPDLEGAKEFVVPVPPANATGAPPVNVDVAMAARGNRIVAAATLPEGPSLSGTVELPTGLLFRRQVNKIAVMGPNPRPIAFKGLSVDPDDGRVVEELGWKHVQHVDVFVKANDGRNFSAFTKAKADGTFAFERPLPPGGYQVDASAILEMDDNTKNLLGEPQPDLNAATVLIRVGPGDRGPIKAALKLHTAPFTRRLRNDDPSQRMSELRGTLTRDGKPVPDARVVLYGGIATRWKIADTSTDSAGKFRFENVVSSVIGRGAEAKYYVGAQVEHPNLVPADGKSWRDISIPTKPGTVETMDLALTEGGFVEGRLLGAAGKPRAKAALKLYIPAKPGVRRGASLFHAYATTDDRGDFRSEPLFPGRYFVEENEGDYPLLGEITVEAGKTVRLP